MTLAMRNDSHRPVGRKPKPKDEHAIPVGLRLPPDVLKRVDTELARVAAETGMEPSRSMLLLALIRQALDARDKSRGK
jgi:hypothetical protein